MKLSQFLTVMKEYFEFLVEENPITKRRSNGERLKFFLNSFIFEDDEINPMDDKSPDFLGKIYNGSESFPMDCASYVKSHLDSTIFEDISEKLTDDAKRKMIHAFAQCHELVNYVDFEQDITNILDRICYNILNVEPSASIRYAEFLADGKVKIGGKTINLPAELDIPDIINENKKYVDALIKVYEQDTNKPVKTIEDLNTLHPRYLDHFKMQRKSYYSAESVLHQIRDIFQDAETEFKVLKDETETGIFEVVYNKYKNGMERLNTTLIHVQSINYGKSFLARNNVGLIGSGEKRGIVHMLVNDSKIQWVVNYDEDI